MGQLAMTHHSLRPCEVSLTVTHFSDENSEVSSPQTPSQKGVWLAPWCSKLTTGLGTSMPYGCWFKSWLYLFQSSSLLMGWKGNRGWSNFLGLCTQMGNSEETPGSWLQPGPALLLWSLGE